MEEKDCYLHNIGEVNLFNGYEEMNSSPLTIKEELYSEVSSEVKVFTCTPENDVDTKFMNSNESVPFPLQDNGQVSINDSENSFCFVGIKTENPDDYKIEAPFANSETKNTSVKYSSNQGRQCSVDDQYVEEKSPLELSNISCMKIKMECDEDIDSCKSNNMSVPVDMNKKCDPRPVVHGCDMGHSSSEFIRGIECEEYPILRVKAEEGENAVMQNTQNSRISSEPVPLDDRCENEVTINSAYDVNSSRFRLKEARVVLERVYLKGVYPSLQTETGNKASEIYKTSGASPSRNRTLNYEKQLSYESRDNKNDLNRMCHTFESDTEITCSFPDALHRLSEYASAACKVSYRQNEDPKNHMETHSEGMPFSSEVSKGSFNSRGNVNRHLGTHSREKPYKCDVCQDSFRHAGNLKRHMRTHTGEKRFKCDVCQVSFSQKSVKRHMRTHTGEKRFNCDVCQVSFNQKSDLKRHMRTHTGDKPFKCDVCQISISERGGLKRHMRTHTGDKPFKCDVCQVSFRQAGHLKSHMRTHTGDKPFKCDVCKVSFRVAESLKSHMRIHTGDKPFKCDVCQVTFSVRASLKRHMRTHTGEKRFKCDVCLVSFSQICGLKRHVLIHAREIAH